DSPDPSETPEPEPTDSETPGEPSEEPSEEQTPSAPGTETPPSEDDLADETTSTVTVPDTVRPGDAITVNVSGVADGTKVDVWLFSDPVHLGSHTVTNGTVHVTVPANTTPGVHHTGGYDAQVELSGSETDRV